MSIRNREWTTPAGVKKSAWQVDYRDAQGKRRSKQFDRKKEAQAFDGQAEHEVRQGTHTADSASITLGTAADAWLKRAARDLELSTVNAYRQHVELHIRPFLGARRHNQLTRPAIVTFRDELLDAGRSKAMVSRVLRSLTAIISAAEEAGHVAKNAARGVRLKRAAREKPKVTPASKADMRALIEAARKVDNKHPSWLPMLLVLNFAGLRASELRALPWRNVDLDRKTLTIDQRADFTNAIGPPKSGAGYRTIPLPEMVVAAGRTWKGRCQRPRSIWCSPRARARRSSTPTSSPASRSRYRSAPA